MDRQKKLVYVPMAVDTIHPGHLNIIKIASELGEVMVGLFTDEAIASYKRIPVMNYEQRKAVIESIKGVDIVVKQETRDYEPNLRTYKPDYMVHGTDWREGPLSAVRERAIEVMAEWGGSIVEPEYTKGVSSSTLHAQEGKNGFTPVQKMLNLKRMLETKKHSQIMGVFNGQTALAAEEFEMSAEDGVKRRFDAIWVDRQGIALARGIKKQELLDMSQCFDSVREICLLSNKPIIMEYFGEDVKGFLRNAEQAGVSAIVIHAADRNKMKELLRDFRNLRKHQEMMILVSADLKEANEIEAYAKAGAEGIVINSCSFKIVQEISQSKEMKLPVLLALDENINNEGQHREEELSGIIYKNVISSKLERVLKELLTEVLM